MSKEINRDYIEGPAGVEDQFVICGVDMNKINEKEPVKVKGKMKRVAISTELEKGMSIPVENNKQEMERV